MSSTAEAALVLPECGGPSRNSSLGDIDSCASVMTRLAAIRVVSREMAGKFGGRLLILRNYGTPG